MDWSGIASNRREIPQDLLYQGWYGMVTASTAQLPPPENWDEFEQMSADLFGEEWQDRNVTRYGRQGQRQNGVDIYGRPDGEGYAGVQGKGKKVWPPRPLKTSDIDEEVEKAKAFEPAVLSENSIRPGFAS
jgi:hypothetical protein